MKTAKVTHLSKKNVYTIFMMSNLNEMEQKEILSITCTKRKDGKLMVKIADKLKNLEK